MSVICSVLSVSPDLQGEAAAAQGRLAEVYIGDEFIGVLFRDDEEGETSYQFQMAILDFDLSGLAPPGALFALSPVPVRH